MNQIANKIKSEVKGVYKSAHPLSGFVLVEVLMSISIALLIISVLMEIYLSCQHGLKVETALISIKEAAETANTILTNEIHQAGNIGCARLTPDFPIFSLPMVSLSAENKIIATDKNELITRHAEYPNAFLIQPANAQDRIYINNEIRFKVGDILLISDCKKAEITIAHQIKNHHDAQELILARSLHYQYDIYSEVSRLAINKFYTHKTNRNHDDGSPVYGLFVEDIHHHKHELVSGISNSGFKFIHNQEVKGVSINYDIEFPPFKKTWHGFARLK